MFMHNARYADLKLVTAGYAKTGIPLVMHNGNELLAYKTNGADDIGIYVLIPKIANFFNLTLDQALNSFFYSIIFGSFVLGLIGFFLLYHSTKERIVALVGLLCALFLPLKINDVYSIGSCLSIATVPIFMYFIKEKTEARLLYPFLLFTGIGIGFAHYLRAYSGLGVLLFMLILLLFQYNTSFAKKALFIATLFFGTAIPIFYVNNQCTKYKNYAEKHFPSSNIIKHHTFWHTVYCGLGFLSNNHELAWNDGISFNKAKSIDPALDLDDYEKIDNIIKMEILKLFKIDPGLLFHTIFAKLGVLIFFLLRFAHIFFLCSFLALWYRKPWPIEIAFMSLITFNMLFPIIAMPFHTYSIGLITSVILYSIASLNEYLKPKATI